MARTRQALVICCAILLSALALLPAAPAAAATATIDPNGDGAVGSNWAVTPAGTYYTAIDDAVRQPNVPSTSDHISLANNRSDTAAFELGTTGGVLSASSVTLWLYHNDSTNSTIWAALYDSAETNQYGTEQAVTTRSTNGWDSVTFSGLTLSQTALDGMRFRVRVVKGSGATSTATIYAAYATVTYDAAVLSADIVDGTGTPVASPSASMSSVGASLACQTSSGSLGSISQRIRLNNTTANGNWTLSIAATGGATAMWGNGSANYDFNDPGGSPAGCGDGGDADTLAGRLTVDASPGTITPQSGCSGAGVSKGAVAGFSQGVVDNVTLMSATGSQTSCYYDLTGVTLSQTIPGETPANLTPYTINMTLTVTAN